MGAESASLQCSLAWEESDIIFRDSSSTSDEKSKHWPQSTYFHLNITLWEADFSADKSELMVKLRNPDCIMD